MKEYLYETHLHTLPVSKCAKAGVRESLEFYKSLGYDGVFITNHFIDGNINCDKALSYEDRIHFYCSDYEEGVRIGRELGIKVFFGIESSMNRTDFLIYGLDKAWLLAHPEIEEMPKAQMLDRMAQAGALVIQAHPFRESKLMDYIRLFPRHVHGAEVYNAGRTEFENAMAELYATRYSLIPFAGSDNHRAGGQKRLGGMRSGSPISDEADFVRRVKNGELTPFQRENPQLD